MAEGVKISQMDEKFDLQGTEYLPIVDESGNKKVKIDKLVSKTDADSTYQPKGNYVTEEGLSSKDYITSTTASSTYQPIGDYITEEDLNSKGYITSDTASSTYQPKGDYITEIPDNYITEEELDGKNYITTSTASSTYQPKGDYATTEQLSDKQDNLVSGTNIKTINSSSLLGEGDISITDLGEAPKDGDFYCRKDGAWEKMSTIDCGTFE